MGGLLCSGPVAAILIVEDERVLSRELSRFLEQAGHQVRTARTGAEALECAREDPPDLALLDLRLPDRSGLEILDALRELDGALTVILMTAYGSVQDAVEAMRRGATDYLQKPLDLEELGLLIERVLSEQRRDRELEYLRERGRVLPEGIIGEDERLLAIFDQVERLAKANLPPRERPSILLTGETGTGKGMVAHALHEVLGGGPFVEVNCTAMPATLVEGELFGHERGSFTDARASRAGLFEAADGGTIFLDEIGDLDAGSQAKFLTAIEEKRIRRLGSTRDRPVNVQVVAATHQDLDEATASGGFRADLLHRLRVLSFEIPALRERRGDLPLLARRFVAQLGKQYGRPGLGLSRDAEARIADYGWPGNVRELRNVLERAVLLATRDEIGAEELGAIPAGDGTAAGGPRGISLPEGGVVLEDLERDLIRQALDRAEGNRTRAAALLGLSRDTLRYRIEKHGLE